jgi:transcriptional regulator with XRE-family HTH domain
MKNIEVDDFLTLIKQAREEKGVSQRDIAKYLGITQPSYNSIECGHTALKVETLLQLADFLEINLFFNPDTAITQENSEKLNEKIDKSLDELNEMQQEVKKITTKIVELREFLQSKRQ